MNPLGIGQTILSQGKTSENRTLSFRTGQIFSGKVLKLYPNQIAEVQVGSQKIIAHLETPLSVSDRHWFQVQAGEGKIHLRVLETLNENGKSPSIESLLKQFNLPISKDNLSVMQLFLKEQFPVTKDSIVTASEWLKQSDSLQDGLQVIKLMLSKQLPFTKDVFLSLSTVIKNESLSTLLTNLQTQLMSEQTANHSEKLLSLLNEITMTEKEKVNNLGFAKITSEWLTSGNNSNIAFKLLQNLGFISKTATNEETVNQLMAKWLNNERQISSLHNGKTPFEPQLLNDINNQNNMGNREGFILSVVKLMNHLKNTPDINIQNNYLNEWQKISSGVRANQLTVPLDESRLLSLEKEIFRALFIDSSPSLSKNIALSLPSSNLSVETGFKQLEQAFSLSHSTLSKALSNEEQVLLTKIRDEIQIETVRWDDSIAVKEHMKALIKGLGLNYEHELANLLKQQNGESIAKLEALKPLLMQLLKEEVAVPIKEAAEKLMLKITGYQVLSQEAGPIQQYVFQIPLSFWEKKTDLTMQWSGRKTADGKIDSNFCRVLFYLDLDYLHETIIDLQVQNRIMNLAIINERTDLKSLATPFILHLKEGLANLNYQLSSVTFEQPVEQKQLDEVNDVLSTMIVPNTVSGVDYRI